MSEVFVDIVGYEGLYQISNMGRIKSMERKILYKNTDKYILRERIMKRKKPKGNDYRRVQLRKNGVYKPYLLHRLVATHFVLNPDNKPQVNHKDGIKSNCVADNLEWVTRSENTIHAISTGLIIFKNGEKHHAAKLSDKDISEMRRIHKEGRMGYRKIAKMFNVNHGYVSRIINNQRRTA